jgi:acetate kinase
MLVFTGGGGENSPTVRQGAAERVGFLGVAIDTARNDTGRSDTGRSDNAQPDRDISAAGVAVQTLVIAAREDLEIAREVRQLLQP